MKVTANIWKEVSGDSWESTVAQFVTNYKEKNGSV